MGRKRNIELRDFFTEKDGSSECKSCGRLINGIYITNLKRHLDKYHSESLKEYGKKMKLADAEMTKNSKIKFAVEMSENEVINACIDMVTKESLPLSFFDSKPFQILTSPVFEGLKISKINSRNIMCLVHSKCQNIKAKIKDILKDKIISLKIDTATRSDRAILGINVQTISDNKIAIFSLAMLELKKRHTAENLKTEIENVLKDFNIDKKQIYSITTDNGRNLVKAVELLSPDESEEEEELEEFEEDQSETTYEKIVNSINFENILSIKCAAHTLQLSVKDFLKDYNSTIDRARKATKFLRTPTFRNIIKNLNIAKPQLDVVTRWNSTYSMLKRLLQLQEFCIQNLPESEQLKVCEWEAISNIVSVLEPVHLLTLKLQKSQLFLGDFYKYWLELTLQLKHMNTDNSKTVLAHIESRQTALLENDTMYAALYLDPRFRRLLSHQKKEAAKGHLRKIVQQIENLKRIENVGSKSASQGQEFLIDESSVQSSSSLLRSSLREMEIINSSSDDEESNIDENLLKAFTEIDTYTEKRMDVDQDLMEYWNDKKYTLPWLRKLALIVHSVPATQVSVERSFSALKLILADLRYNLSQENLEALMTVKLNSEIF